jgi:hypothetical protein
MLFSYKYVTQSIEDLQVYLDRLVKHVWCGPSDAFSIDLLHPGLKAVVLAIFNAEEDIPRGRIGDWLYGPIRNIYGQSEGSSPPISVRKWLSGTTTTMTFKLSVLAIHTNLLSLTSKSKLLTSN